MDNKEKINRTNRQTKSGEINLFYILKDTLRYWKWFLISATICLLLSFLYIFSTQKVYQINANVLIKNESEKGGGSAAMSSMLQGFSFGGSLGMGGGSVDNELLLLSSYTMLRNTIIKLQSNVRYVHSSWLDKKDYFMDSPLVLKAQEGVAENFVTVLEFKATFLNDGGVEVKVKEGWSTVAEVNGKNFPLEITTPYGDFTLDKTDFYSKTQVKDMDIVFMGYDLATEILLEQVFVTIKEKKANGINLSIEETNIKRGKALLNTMIDLYNLEGATDKNVAALKKADFIDKRIQMNENELSEIERKIEEYKKENNLTDLETEAEIMLAKNGDFQEKLIDSEIQYATVNMIEEFLLDPANKYALAPFNLGVMEKTASEGLQQYNDFLLERARLLTTSTEDNPTIVLLSQQIDLTRKNVLETFKSIKAGYDFARRDLNAQQAEYVNRIKKMPTQEREFLDMKRQQMVKSELYIFLLQQKEEASMTLANSMEKAKIIDSAYSLSKAIKPNKLFVFSIALIISLIIPIISLLIKNFVKFEE